MPIIERSKLSGLIPEPVTQEIMQGTVTESAVLKMARRLPNMSSKTQSINVLDALPTAYFVSSEPTDNGADSNAFKRTTSMAWDKKKLVAEEIAVIVPVPEAVLDDSNYDIWGEVRPRLSEAFGRVIDSAILFGTNRPTTWRDGIVPSAAAAGNVILSSDNIFSDIMGEGGVIARIEGSGYDPNGAMSSIQMRSKLRGLVDTTGQPIFKSDMQGDTRYALDGINMYFPKNGAFDPAEALMIMGDWNQMVYAIRQDITFKIFTEGVIQDPATGDILYNLMQNDMVALRAVMRLGWEIANPLSAFNENIPNPFPFAVYKRSGTISTVTVSPSTATLAAGSTKTFAASVEGSGDIDGGVNWTVSGGADAGTVINKRGRLTVGKAETATSLTVTATSRQNSEKSGTATITVGE